MVKPLPDLCSIVRVQTWDSQAVAPLTVERALGITWPMETGTVASGRADVICTGPTDWLVMTAHPDAAPLLQRLHETFGGSAFRATDLTQALALVEIAGPDARVLLAKGCALDLHPSRFAPGCAARSRFADMPVIVRCIRESTFHCIVESSYRDYLILWLADAAAEFSRN
jgi:sarcosine oxidase, subunit gamma